MKQRGRIVAFFLIVILFFSLMGTTVTGIAKKINLGLDLQGGFEVLYQVKPIAEGEKTTKRLLESTVQTLDDRVNRLGISEASINIEGNDRIRVQLAGVQNQEQAREVLSTSAQLSFRDVNDKELLNGSDVKEGSAKQDFDQKTNQPIVSLKLKDAKKFANVTSTIKNMNNSSTPYQDNLLVIWMDYEKGDSFAKEYNQPEDKQKYISAPQVSETLNTSNVMISGNFTVESAKRLADIINSGSLPVTMKELYSTSVGAQFGEQALHQTINAGYIGVGLVLLFMLVFYRFPGLIAGINLCIYVYLILLLFNWMNGVLTLPGIAALILGVGMAVDANVITFERIKEDLRLGKSLPQAFKGGTKNSFSTILDANITTLLAAAILFVFGTSSVKGFATMLIVSVLVSFITAVYGTRILLGLWMRTKFLMKRPGLMGVSKKNIKSLHDKEDEEAEFMGKKLNVVKHRKVFFGISIALLLIGAVSLVVFKLNPGIDFTSGSRVEMLADQKLTSQQVKKDLSDLDLKAKAIVISGKKSNTAVMRFDNVLSKSKLDEMKSHFKDEYKAEPSVSVVSPIVGKELVKNAVYAVGLAMIGMIIYVSFRFEVYFATTAIITLLHNVILVLAFFSLFRLEFDVTIIAALLTIVGYTINDTIVIFDRIRENLRKHKIIKSKELLQKIVNKSIVQSLTRSINTSFTTLLAVLVFLFIGAPSIRGFAIAMAVGLIIGAYSSLFIAAQLWLVWRGRSIERKPIEYKKKKRTDQPVV
ncbi:protein translocase subunit SecDF [Aciduricibacillus chroicocephali]|uniref:Multifunctional fusion protein n=1 Tax=Aciduricibacillus chroicocephali TaxID=3054939 RepID=A0ABY9KRY6_9BACI|nr:protein translocase subunit SecDF [Bacillaceae bacterium 44XB]